MTKKSNFIVFPSNNVTCSTLNDVTPTVSASSFVSLFPPTRNEILSIKYSAVAGLCLLQELKRI